MTDTERNELVKKLTTFDDGFRFRNEYLKRKFLPGEVDSAYSIVIKRIESLGYEIVKKEHWKEATDAFVLQQIRAGNFVISNSPENPTS